MELQFPKSAISCLRRIKGEVQTLEQTQELRMPEEMPDIGSVLGAWGQVLLRGKEWRDDSMVASGGVMTWVMYRPEGEAENVQMVEAWIPFQIKWDLPHTQHDGRIRISPLLRSVDARTTSARKLVARVTVSLLAEAFISEEVQVCTPDNLPEDIQVLKKTYPLLLPKEAGEKAFELDEELTLPASCPAIDKLLRFSLQPELIDQKVLSGKVVFRGAALLHVVYLSEAGELCAWDFEIPYSQYAQLDTDYEQEAQCRIAMAVTSLELDCDMDGKLCLKAGLTGQYVIYDRSTVEVCQDAYSLQRTVEGKSDSLELPMVLEQKLQTITAKYTVTTPGSQIMDLAFYPDQPRLLRNGDTITVELGGLFQVLYLDEAGTLQSAAPRWSESLDIPADENTVLELTVSPSGTPQGSVSGMEPNLRADILMDFSVTATQGIPMFTGLEAGQPQQPDPNRPSLILRKKNRDSLWDMAKKCGSTVEIIQRANHLEGEPENGRILLIPVL